MDILKPRSLVMRTQASWIRVEPHGETHQNVSALWKKKAFLPAAKLRTLFLVFSQFVEDFLSLLNGTY